MAKRVIIGGLGLLIASTLSNAQNLLVVSVSSTPAQITEGQPMTWTFKLSQPTPKEGLSVTLNLTQDDDPAPGDVKYNAPGSQGITQSAFTYKPDGSIQGMMVTLAGGVTEAVVEKFVDARDVGAVERRNEDEGDDEDGDEPAEIGREVGEITAEAELWDADESGDGKRTGDDR